MTGKMIVADGGLDVVALLGLDQVPAPASPTLDAEVGRRVRDARRRAGLDAKDFAEQVGLSRDKISKIEHGHRRVSPRELPAIARALHVSIQSLLGSAGAERPTLALAHRVATTAPRRDTSGARKRAIEVLEAEARLERNAGLAASRLSPGGAAIEQLVATQFADVPRTRAEAQRQGRHLAEEVRRALELGIAEIGDLPALAEMHFAVDVALSPLGDSSDGLCAHDGHQALLVANTDYTLGHVRFTLAHELGHHLLRDPREIIEEQTSDMFGASYRERRVNAFAGHLLLPIKAITTTLAWLDCADSDIETANARGRTALGYLMTRYGVSLQCTLSQVAAAGVVPVSAVSALKDRLPAGALVRAAGHLISERPEPVMIIRDHRPPIRLVNAALDAARAGHVGLHTVAVLLGRKDDDALFDEVMLADGSESLDPDDGTGRIGAMVAVTSGVRSRR